MAKRFAASAAASLSAPDDQRLLTQLSDFLRDWNKTDQGKYRLQNILEQGLNFEDPGEVVAFLIVMQKVIKKVVADKPVTR